MLVTGLRASTQSYVSSPFLIFYFKSLSCPGCVWNCAPPASASQSARITGIHHCTLLSSISLSCFRFIPGFIWSSPSLLQQGSLVIGKGMIIAGAPRPVGSWSENVAGASSAPLCCQLFAWPVIVRILNARMSLSVMAYMRNYAIYIDFLPLGREK